MGGRPKKVLCERLSFDLNWAELSDADRLVLEKRADEGKPVSLIDECPDVPADVGDIYRAFAELRSSTPSDQPISYTHKLAAWEIHGREDFSTFSSFIGAMDEVFLKHQADNIDKRREKKKSIPKPKGKQARQPRKPALGKPVEAGSESEPAIVSNEVGSKPQT